ncbi:MAG: hypothetical protein ACRDYE_03855, partial [Acidimicrobiales bacterium]
MTDAPAPHAASARKRSPLQIEQNRNRNPTGLAIVKNLGLHTGDVHHGMAEVELGPPRWMAERDEDLLRVELVSDHRLL